MTTSQLVPLLKTDLGLTANNFDERLATYIDYAKGEIGREGITLQDNLSDNQLVVMYAAYLWSKRTTGEAMPRMLRYALNNRLLSEKAGVG